MPKKKQDRKPKRPATRQQAQREADSSHRNRQDPAQEPHANPQPAALPRGGEPRGVTPAGHGGAPG